MPFIEFHMMLETPLRFPGGAIKSDTFGRFLNTQYPVLQHPKDVLLDSDPVMRKATEELIVMVMRPV